MQKLLITTLFLAAATSISAQAKLPHIAGQAVMIGRMAEKPDTTKVKCKLWFSGDRHDLMERWPYTWEDDRAGNFKITTYASAPVTVMWNYANAQGDTYYMPKSILMPGDTTFVVIHDGYFTTTFASGKKAEKCDSLLSKCREMLIHDAVISDKYRHQTFEQYRDSAWLTMLERKAQLPDSRFWNCLCEGMYIHRMEGFKPIKRFTGGLSDEEKQAFCDQYTLADPRADQLTLWHSDDGRIATRLLNLSLYDYAEANNQLHTPLGIWESEVRQAEAVLDSIKRVHVFADDDPIWQTFPTAYLPLLKKQNENVRQLLGETAANLKGARKDTPQVAPEEMLPAIIAEHKGRYVFVDFWATWCGPCRLGMKAMEPVKERWSARGYDFVYITDSSSDLSEWREIISTERGDHYLIPSDIQKRMNIPGYDNAIPHYLIYDPKGRLLKTHTGWGGIEQMEALLEEAVAK